MDGWMDDVCTFLCFGRKNQCCESLKRILSYAVDCRFQ